MSQTEEKAAAIGGDTANDRVQHIMISYDWHHKEPVRKMNAALQRLGYVTWLDVEQMSE
jgi:hypothetical protein